MPFPIHFPCSNPALSEMQLNPGEMLFVLGANGAGKSSLMQHFAAQNHGKSRKISAHRQTWMASDTLDMTPAHKVAMDQQIQSDDHQQHARHKDRFGAQRASMTVFELIDAENIRARTIAAEVDAGRMDGAKDKAKSEAPIKVINELLRLSNIPIEITIHANERVMASKDGGPVYSAAELSDGERNALLIAGSVLTAPTGTLIIVDEPERHLHRSIISPLLNQLFQRRLDCAFIIATHDHDLPLENPAARTLLVRSCTFNGQTVQSWGADELGANTPLDDILKRDLLGARRKILFVEGTESSLDKPLYSLIFPQVSVIPKGTCRDVEHAVEGLTAGKQLHWLRAFGVIDGDGYDTDSITAKAEKGVYAIPYYSVEAIYFHPRVIEMVAQAQANVSGDDARALTDAALTAAIAVVRANAERLCSKAVKKTVEKAIIEQLPDGNRYLTRIDTNIVVDGPALLEKRKLELFAALDRSDWATVLTLCPIKDGGVRGAIARSLKLQSDVRYQKAVQHLLTNNPDALTFVRSLFANLHARIEE